MYIFTVKCFYYLFATFDGGPCDFVDHIFDFLSRIIATPLCRFFTGSDLFFIIRSAFVIVLSFFVLKWCNICYLLIFNFGISVMDFGTVALHPSRSSDVKLTNLLIVSGNLDSFLTHFYYVTSTYTYFYTLLYFYFLHVYITKVLLFIFVFKYLTVHVYK